MNRITDEMQTGTVGELLVQLRLLEHGIQAAPPLKDSGNDLIAIKGTTFRAIQVKTTTQDRFQKPDGTRLYHVLAVVQLVADEHSLYLDQSKVYLVPAEAIHEVSTRTDDLNRFLLTAAHAQYIFG
jgi:hypothetical protein